MKKIFSIIAALCLASNAFASSVSEIQRNIDTRYEDLRRQQEIENRTKFIKEKQEEPVKQQTETASPAKRQFDRIDIRRSEVPGISQARINAILKPYSSLMLGVNEISDIQNNLQTLYINEGYGATRVYIDGNTMPENILTFVIVDGYIEDISFKRAKGKKYSALSSELQKFSFYPFASGQLLNIRDIDQGLEQMNRLVSNNASMEITPGTKEGYSIIEITNDIGRRFNLSLSADNSGLENTGYYKANSAINADNLLMLNDNIYFNYSRNIDGNWDNKSNNSYFASLSIPFGYFTFMSSFFKSDYNTRSGSAQGQRYISDGSTQNKNAGLEMVVKRAASYKMSAGADIALKENENFFDGQKINVSSKKLTVASAFLTGTSYFGSSMFYGKLSYSQGLDWFGAAKNSGIAGAPKGQYYSLALYTQYSRQFNMAPVNLPSSYSFAFNAQHSPDILFGSEQISLGGQSSVRGYKEGSVSGDSGFSVRNDFNWVLANIFKRAGIFNILARTTLNVFADYGYARNRAFGQDYQLAGSGAGLLYRSKYFNASAIWSRSIYNNSYLPDEGDVVYFSIEGKIYF